MLIMPATGTNHAGTEMPERFDETQTWQRNRERRNPNICAGVTRTLLGTKRTDEKEFDETQNVIRQLTGTVLLGLAH